MGDLVAGPGFVGSGVGHSPGVCPGGHVIQVAL
jgi:hypothetical protein